MSRLTYTVLSRMVKVVIGIALLAMIAGRINAQTPDRDPARAQGLITEKSLSMGMAKTIAEAAQEECRAKGFHTAVAVVDRAGELLILLRDEKAAAHTIEMARRKAYTARMFRIPTAEFQKRTLPDQPQAAQRDLTDILALSGGVPIKIGDETIGAVASAGSSLEMDDACAKAGIAKVAELLK